MPINIAPADRTFLGSIPMWIEPAAERNAFVFVFDIRLN
jgi:hypothetical protein